MLNLEELEILQQQVHHKVMLEEQAKILLVLVFLTK
jgi:hypothetical protein